MRRGALQGALALTMQAPASGLTGEVAGVCLAPSKICHNQMKKQITYSRRLGLRTITLHTGPALASTFKNRALFLSGHQACHPAIKLHANIQHAPDIGHRGNLTATIVQARCLKCFPSTKILRIAPDKDSVKMKWFGIIPRKI
jgi:hypothetical protein